MNNERRSDPLAGGLPQPLYDPEAQRLLAAALDEKCRRPRPEPHVLRAAATAHRRAGNQRAAAALYRRLLDVGGADATDRYLCALFEDRPWTAPDALDGTRPAPWVVVQDFLSADERDRLLSFYLSHENGFKPPTVAADDGEQELTFLKAPIDKDKGLRASFEGAVGSFCRRRFAAAFQRIAGRFHIDPSSIGESDLLFYLLAYGSGNSFPPHVDHRELEGERRLTLNAVYTFWREPRRFSGGDLLLFDTDAAGDTYDAAGYTRISPMSNALVVFPSDRYHAVTAIRCRDDEFAGGRFVLTGVLLRAAADGP